MEIEDDKNSYYAIFNLPRDATQQNIRSAYKQLAQALHPDKQERTPEAQAIAAASFQKVSEAYEVLSNKEQRAVYDVYGKAGLAYGMEVGEELRDYKDIKAKWEQFKQQQNIKAELESTRQKMTLTLRSYWADCLFPQPNMQRQPPAIGSMSVVAQSQAPGLWQDDQTSVQATMHLKHEHIKRVQRPPGVSANEFLARVQAAQQQQQQLQQQSSIVKTVQHGIGQFSGTYVKQLGLTHQMQGTVQIGQQLVGSVSSTFQLTELDSVSCTLVGSAKGTQIQLETGRKLGYGAQGSVTFVISNNQQAALGCRITKALFDNRAYAVAKFEISTSSMELVLKYVHEITPYIVARTAVRLLPTQDVEFALTRKLGPDPALPGGQVGCMVRCMAQGVLVRPQLLKGSLQLDLPMVVSRSPTDARALLVCYILPMGLMMITNYYVAPRIHQHIKNYMRDSITQQQLTASRNSIAQAYSEQQVLHSTAQARLKQEADAGGLVVLAAVYGKLPSDVLGCAIELRKQTMAMHSSDNNNSSNNNGHSNGDTATPHLTPPHSGTNGSTPPSASTPPPPAPTPTPPPPTPPTLLTWLSSLFKPPKYRTPSPTNTDHVLDVTTCMQFLTRVSELALPTGISKSGMVGFCDPTPPTPNHASTAPASALFMDDDVAAPRLYIVYLYKMIPYEVFVDECAGVILPSLGERVLQGSSEWGKVRELCSVVGIEGGN